MCNAHATLQQSPNPDHSPGELYGTPTRANAYIDSDTRCHGDGRANSRADGRSGFIGYTPDPIDSVAPSGHVSGVPNRHTLHRFGRK